jgi:hypothetical protein
MLSMIREKPMVSTVDSLERRGTEVRSGRMSGETIISTMQRPWRHLAVGHPAAKIYEQYSSDLRRSDSYAEA